MPAVHLDDLLEAAEREHADRVHAHRRELDRVARDARVRRAVLVAGPLLVREEEVVLDADAGAPLVLLLQVRGAERHHHPVGLCGNHQCYDSSGERRRRDFRFPRGGRPTRAPSPPRRP